MRSYLTDKDYAWVCTHSMGNDRAGYNTFINWVCLDEEFARAKFWDSYGAEAYLGANSDVMVFDEATWCTIRYKDYRGDLHVYHLEKVGLLDTKRYY